MYAEEQVEVPLDVRHRWSRQAVDDDAERTPTYEDRGSPGLGGRLGSEERPAREQGRREWIQRPGGRPRRNVTA